MCACFGFGLQVLNAPGLEDDFYSNLVDLICNLASSKNVNQLFSTHGYSQNQIIVWRFPAMTKVLYSEPMKSTCLIPLLSISTLLNELFVYAVGNPYWNLFVRMHRLNLELLFRKELKSDNPCNLTASNGGTISSSFVHSYIKQMSYKEVSFPSTTRWGKQLQLQYIG